jgi:predicted RNA-binding Zn-ribbon protein involved in translation (DUF1610 family)
VPAVVRSSSISLKFANPGKLERFAAFEQDYRQAVQAVIDHAWINGLHIDDYTFDVKKDLLKVPNFVPKHCLPALDTPLSGRAMKCASTQAMAMIKAAVKRRSKDLCWLSKLDGTPVPAKLAERLKRPLVKPAADQAKPELNSLCANIVWTSKTSFDGWLILSSLGKAYGKLAMPLKKHRHFNKLASGKQLSSVQVDADSVAVRFASEPKANNGTRTVGADSGMKTVLSLSDGQTTKDIDEHGHSLTSICESLSRKKKGSKAFAKVVEHRTNFVNRSINALDLSGICRINLEKIVNINHGRRASRQMIAWTSTSIRDKVIRLGEERNVSVVLQASAYRSQRCSKCGNVRRANRKGKVYSCLNCGFIGDADINAACNHEQNLPKVPMHLFRTKLNLGKGFLWLSSGFCTLSGAELTVPLSLQEATT